MTIAICLKVGDGVVLGADSATTMVNPDGTVANVYFTAEKLLNLFCGLPVGMATYGLGGLGGRSIIRLARDLRNELHGGLIDRGNYMIKQFAEHVERFFYTERYLPIAQQNPTVSTMGFILAGYSSGESSPEIWTVSMEGANCSGPVQEFSPSDPNGIVWRGMGEALARLVVGWDVSVPALLAQQGVTAAGIESVRPQTAPLWGTEMPIMDAIDMVRYLADVVSGYVRFSPGAQSVAPPIDIAAVTVHEGFRWVSRKHYYDPVYNPLDKYTKPPGGAA